MRLKLVIIFFMGMSLCMTARRYHLASALELKTIPSAKAILPALAPRPLPPAPSHRHSVFLGLPLGGDREAFVDSLEAKGYVLEEEDEECTVLTGLFDGVGARIEVHATPRSHVVHLVTVLFIEMEGNEVGLLMKSNQIRKRLKRKYAKWDHTRAKRVEEWSSPYARISLGKKRLKGDNFKTLYVQWQDRSGWEALQREKQ